jgi:hypothetical protein
MQRCSGASSKWYGSRDSAGHVIPHGLTEGYKIVPKT